MGTRAYRGKCCPIFCTRRLLRICLVGEDGRIWNGLRKFYELKLDFQRQRKKHLVAFFLTLFHLFRLGRVEGRAERPECPYRLVCIHPYQVKICTKQQQDNEIASEKGADGLYVHITSIRHFVVVLFFL